MKKSNAKFIMIVISMLMASSLILGCEMHYVNESDEGVKDYEISHQSFDFESMTEPEVSESTPTPQDELKTKFQSMYEIDEENNAITVISKEYLENYWESNYEKEEIKSLTYDEILFIIQDSIRIYQKYDKIILQGYESRVKYGYISESAEFDRRYPKSEDYVWDGDETEVIWRVPYIETKTISAIDGYYVERNNWGIKNYAVDYVLSDIYTIICYRIEALSSPKVFIQGAELLKKSGEDPEKYSGNLPESVYYCAGMKDIGEREEIIEIFRNQLFTGRGGSIPYRELDLVVLGGEYYSSRILVRDSNKSIYVTNSFFVSDYEEVYMTDDMEQITKDYLNNTLSKEYVATQISGGKEHEIRLTLFPKTNKCSLCSGYDSYWITGDYYFEDDILYLKGILNLNDEEQICIFKVEGETYKFLAETSSPMIFYGISLMDNITFYPVEKPLKWVLADG